jgi:hypothetical protein
VLTTSASSAIARMRLLLRSDMYSALRAPSSARPRGALKAACKRGAVCKRRGAAARERGHHRGGRHEADAVVAAIREKQRAVRGPRG